MISSFFDVTYFFVQVGVAETDIIAQSQAGWDDPPATANPFVAPPQSNPFRR